MNKEIGYEASLAQIEYSVKKFADLGLVFSFEGYSEKLLAFAATFVDLMTQCATVGGFGDLVPSALEKQHKKYKNVNVEVDVRCNSNRLLYLMPDWHHSTHMEQLLRDSWKSEGVVTCPGAFLKDRILTRI